ncbi:MAG: serine protease [Symploca sp. SIO2E6]|nr:serine protease [Symploca sp. SIO2E6]
MLLSRGLTASLIGTAIVVMTPQLATALTPETINQIAQEVTVLIDGINPGSGVLISRQGNRYYVLTAGHVVATEDEYTIVAPDGQRYYLDYSRVQQLPGVDLAVLQFTSDRDYQVATLANYNYSTKFRHVFVSGWSRARGNLTMPTSQFSPGILIRKNFALTHAQDPIAHGYELFYTSRTEIGMSGSPILDSDGRVIGIHGQAEGEEIYDEQSGKVVRLKSGFSSGIPVGTFLRLAQQAGLQLGLRVENSLPTPLTPAEIASIATTFDVSPARENWNAIDWANRGNQLYRLERFPEALTAFERSIQIKPDFYQAWYGRGQVLYTLGEYEEALKSYDRTLQIKPDLHLAWRDQGIVLALVGNPTEAVAAFDKAITIKLDDYVVWYLRGNLLRKHLQAYQEALRSYDQAIKLAPNFAEAWTGKGRALYEVGYYQEALAAFNQANQLNPNLAATWHWRGILLWDWQQPDAAIYSLDKAIQLTPDNYELWLIKGIVLAELGRYQEASASAQQALKLQPQDPEVIDFLNSLAYFN